MNSARLLFLVLFCLGYQFIFPEIEKIIKLSEVGYYRQFWGEETVHIKIECIDGNIKAQYELKKNDRIEIKKTKKVLEKEYLALWDFIKSKNILSIQDAAFLNGNLTDEEFNKLYKKIPRQYAYIYSFYVIIGNEKISFSVDDMGYIKDPRYLEFLDRINGFIEVKTEIDVFGDEGKQ